MRDRITSAQVRRMAVVFSHYSTDPEFLAEDLVDLAAQMDADAALLTSTKADRDYALTLLREQEAALAEKDATIRELQATLALYQSSNKVVFSFDYYMDLLAALDADESSYLVSNALRFKSRVAEMEAELAEKDATIAEMRAAGLRRILADSKEQP